MDVILIAFVSTILSLWLGSIEWRLRNMSNELSKRPTRSESQNYIDIRQEVLRQSTGDLKDDVKRLEEKIDKLIDIQLKR